MVRAQFVGSSGRAICKNCPSRQSQAPIIKQERFNSRASFVCAHEIFSPLNKRRGYFRSLRAIQVTVMLTPEPSPKVVVALKKRKAFPGRALIGLFYDHSSLNSLLFVRQPAWLGISIETVECSNQGLPKIVSLNGHNHVSDKG